MYAATEGNTEKVKELLEEGFSVDQWFQSDSQTALFCGRQAECTVSARRPGVNLSRYDPHVHGLLDVCVLDICFAVHEKIIVTHLEVQCMAADLPVEETR